MNCTVLYELISYAFNVVGGEDTHAVPSAVEETNGQTVSKSAASSAIVETEGSDGQTSVTVGPGKNTIAASPFV